MLIASQMIFFFIAVISLKCLDLSGCQVNIILITEKSEQEYQSNNIQMLIFLLPLWALL